MKIATTKRTTTTDATVTTLAAISLPSNTSGNFLARVTARNTATNTTGNATVVFGAHNIAGVVTIVGTPAFPLSVAAGSDVAMNTIVVTPQASGSFAVVTGAGIVATNIEWQCTMEMLGGD